MRLREVASIWFNWICKGGEIYQYFFFSISSRFVFYTVLHMVCYGGPEVMPHLWIGCRVWRIGLRAPHMWRRSDPRWAELSWAEQDTHTDTTGGLCVHMMKSVLCSLLSCASLLLSDVLATYHLSVGDPQLISTQSFAQSRNNGRPPLRTLNPASKSLQLVSNILCLIFLKDSFSGTL